MTSIPAKYALDLSNDGVSLWHRPSHKSWQLLGKVALGAPNFSAEIEAMKQGHNPDGNGHFMACVRIPPSEVYVSKLDLGSAIGARATDKTKAFLTENTPYSADELVFDLENPDGSNTAYVAAIAKTTISEAKEFITGHGFEALYYTSKLDQSAFPRNPRFYDGDQPVVTTQQPETTKQTKPQKVPVSGGIAVPPPPPMQAKKGKPPQIADPDKSPKMPAAIPVSAVKTDFSDFSTVRSKALIADRSNDKAGAAVSNWTPPPPRISIAQPATTPDISPVKSPGTKPSIAAPKIPEPAFNQITPPHVDTIPIKMPQGETVMSNLRGFFKLRYILAITSLLLIALLYWFYITLFDGKEEIARLQAPLSLSEPQIATSPSALKHKISKDTTPALQQDEIARISQIPAIKKPDLAAEPAPVTAEDRLPVIAFVKKPHQIPDVQDTAPTVPEQAETTLTEAAKAIETPVIANLQNDNTPVAVLAPAPKTNVPAQPAGTLVPTVNGTAGPEGITLFAGRPAFIPPRREQLKISTDPLKDILPIMRSAAFEVLHKTEITNKTIAETAVEPDPAAPEITVEASVAEPDNAPDLLALADPALKTKRPRSRPASVATQAKNQRNSLLARADPALAGIKPKIRPDNLAVPAAMAAAPSDIKVTVQTATSDTIRPHRRPKSLRNVVASIKAENGQIAALGTSVAGKSTPVNIQKEATERARFNKKRISLVGVYGTASKRRALVRLPSGRYVKVEIGQKFSGWKVSAIGESSVRITKGSRNQVLRMPK